MSLASENLITIELAIMFLAGMFFSMMYEQNRGSGSWSGILAGVVWFVLGAYYFVVFAETTSYAISLLFMLIGVIYSIRWFLGEVLMDDAVQMLKDAETM